jgi:hypothetical protein
MRRHSLVLGCTFALLCPLAGCGTDEVADDLTSGGEYEALSNKIVAEQVKCVFHDTAKAQECYSDNGAFGCKGIGACVADVKGPYGQKLTWKSSCGGYAFTIIDGKNEYAEFKCGPQPPPPPPPPIVAEQVKCVFNSKDPQACYSDQGHSCKGLGTCVVDVKGAFGTKLTWKSTCGGYAFTVIDGKNEYAEFKCAAPPPPPPPIVAEQVKCVFHEVDASTSPKAAVHECYSDLGVGCKGIGSCVVDVKGPFGQKVTWKSDCGGYAYTLLDGKSEYAEFKCGAPPPPPPPTASETVTCMFNTKSASPTAKVEECYSDLGVGCKGIGSCKVAIKGPAGQKVLWKSSCGGYATTLLDGKDEYAEFNCGPTPTK